MPKKKADLEDGYTRIANSLLDTIISSALTLRETKVLLFIIRNTYGYNRKERALSHKYISAGTGISYSKIAAVINALQSKNIIFRTAAHGSHPQKIMINTKLNEWNILPQNGVPQKGVDTPNWSTPKEGSISYPELGYDILPQNGVPINTELNKELNTECVGAAQAPPRHTPIFDRLWSEWKYSQAGKERVTKKQREEIENNGYLRMADAAERYYRDFDSRTSLHNQPLSARTWFSGAYIQYLPCVDEATRIWYDVDGHKCKGERRYV